MRVAQNPVPVQVEEDSEPVLVTKRANRLVIPTVTAQMAVNLVTK